MVRMTLFSSTALAFFLITTAPSFAADPNDELARQAVQRFMAAVRNEDLDDLDKAIAVPWFHNGKGLLRQRSDVRKEFEQVFLKRDFTTVNYQISLLVRYESVRDRLSDEYRKLLDQAIQANDRVAMLKVTQAGMPKESVVLFIRLRNGKARVVGLQE